MGCRIPDPGNVLNHVFFLFTTARSPEKTNSNKKGKQTVFSRFKFVGFWFDCLVHLLSLIELEIIITPSTVESFTQSVNYKLILKRN